MQRQQYSVSTVLHSIDFLKMVTITIQGRFVSKKYLFNLALFVNGGQCCSNRIYKIINQQRQVGMFSLFSFHVFCCSVVSTYNRIYEMYKKGQGNVRMLGKAELLKIFYSIATRFGLYIFYLYHSLTTTGLFQSC